jgi:DNA-binding CsgD family transcriptional regulator
MLEAIGMDAVDEAVYRTMLDEPELGVTGLAERLTVAERQIRDALDHLADLALVQFIADGVYVARPKVGLMSLLLRAEEEAQRRRAQLDAARDVISTIVAAYSERERVDLGAKLLGLTAVRDRLAELAAEARSECLSLSPGGAQSSESIQLERPLNASALARGVAMRNIYQDAFRNDPATLAHARWMASLGSQSRTVPTLPMRLVIVDRRIALVPIDPDDSVAGALEIHSVGVVAGLVALFEHVWANGAPIGVATPRAAGGVTPLQRAVVRMLAEGHTDSAVARRLAISARSVQRVVTTVTEQLDAQSRFQAGVEASRRGWV